MTLLGILNGLIAGAYLLALFLLFLYGMNCYAMILLHRRHRAAMLRRDDEVWAAWQGREHALPTVTVQLPIYNERYVVQRLIESVVALHYPRDRLEIQVLDDSTDETTDMASALVDRYRAEGVTIRLVHRRDRTGYKAGALKDGLAAARGDVVAIFDADFVPAPDFLMRTVPFFEDPSIAMVQVRWGHINREYSLLTRAQSFGIDGHFWVEQAARCWSGLFLNFNGTAGIWRRAAIEDAGGWHADTLTEDLDLSYRAQLRGWRLKFLPQVECPAELPVQIAAYRSQQHRWAKGSIQTARKLAPRILRADLPLFTKVQAIIHLTNYLVHPLMLFVAAASPILLWLEGFLSGVDQLLLGAAFFSIAFFGPSSLFLYPQVHLYPDWKRRLVYFPTLMIFGTGIALNNTKAILEAVLNVNGAFVRTPKFRIETLRDTWVGKRYQSRFSWLSVLEALLALYCMGNLALFSALGGYPLNPFLILYTLGFSAVAVRSVWESLQAAGSTA